MVVDSDRFDCLDTLTELELVALPAGELGYLDLVGHYSPSIISLQYSKMLKYKNKPSQHSIQKDNCLRFIFTTIKTSITTTFIMMVIIRTLRSGRFNQLSLATTAQTTPTFSLSTTISLMTSVCNPILFRVIISNNLYIALLVFLRIYIIHQTMTSEHVYRYSMGRGDQIPFFLDNVG